MVTSSPLPWQPKDFYTPHQKDRQKGNLVKGSLLPRISIICIFSSIIFSNFLIKKSSASSEDFAHPWTPLESATRMLFFPFYLPLSFSSPSHLEFQPLWIYRTWFLIDHLLFPELSRPVLSWFFIATAAIQRLEIKKIITHRHTYEAVYPSTIYCYLEILIVQNNWNSPDIKH